MDFLTSKKFVNNGGSKTPWLFATLGFPGSGKTFFSRRFAKERGLFHLNSDRVRAEIFLRPHYTQAENEAVFRVMDFVAEELISIGVSVVYDANSTKRMYRRGLQKIAVKHGGRYLLLWFQTPVEVALRRIRKRNELKRELLKKYHQPINASVLFRIKKAMEVPRHEPFILLDGTRTYQEQAGILRAHLGGRGTRR